MFQMNSMKAVLTWLILIGFACSTIAVSCPTNCRCKRNSEGKIIARCRDYSNIPYGLPPQLQLLEMNHNRLTSLSDDSFFSKNLSQLKYLLLRQNQIRMVSLNATTPLQQLYALDLGGNNITYLHENTFRYNRNLSVLSLGYNKHLQIPTTGAFIRSDSIRKLDLHGCDVVIPDVRVFADMPNLKILDLSGNDHLDCLQLKRRFKTYLPNIKYIFCDRRPFSEEENTYEMSEEWELLLLQYATEVNLISYIAFVTVTISLLLVLFMIVCTIRKYGNKKYHHIRSL